jgi:L-alanine-DL-glutamate epimerase-like enolase superfamily enzyme
LVPGLCGLCASDHAIADLQAFTLREPGSGRGYSLLKASTDQWLTGWGESPPASLTLARSVAVGQETFRYDVLTRWLSGDPIAAAVNMALLDLYGQEAKAPIFQLFDWPTRFKAIFVNSSLPMPGSAVDALC